MTMKGHRPGGGIASKQNVEVRVRTGSGSHSSNPGYIAQLGNKVGNHTTDRGTTPYTGEIFHNADKNYQPTPFGNEVALNVRGGGPGAGRKIYASGSQGTQGQPARGNPEPARDILSSFGPESSRVR
jgi:hypothetical protein